MYKRKDLNYTFFAHQAKLGAAANVAKSGIEVVIAECCSSSAEIAMGGITKDTKMCKGTIIRRYQN